MCSTSCNLLCLPKTTLTYLRVPVDQTDAPPVVLMNHRQVDEVFKVDHIDVGCTFVHKNGCANQEQEATPQCISLTVVNLYIIIIDILNPLQLVFINFFQDFKSRMSISGVSYLICNVNWVRPQICNQHLAGFLSAEASVS